MKSFLFDTKVAYLGKPKLNLKHYLPKIENPNSEVCVFRIFLLYNTMFFACILHVFSALSSISGDWAYGFCNG